MGTPVSTEKARDTIALLPRVTESVEPFPQNGIVATAALHPREMRRQRCERLPD